MTDSISSDISDMSAYNGRMVRSLMDKIFFADKIDAGCIVDFGCADGALLKALSPWVPGVRLFGIDSDPKMAVLAMDNLTPCRINHPEIDVFKTLKDAKHRIGCIAACSEKPIGPVALNLSSVIHEVYNYSSVEGIQEFFQELWADSFWDYIVIRDMSVSRSVDRPSDPADIARVYRKFLYTKELKEFESCWGSIENNKNLVHFLLKYRYTSPNWPREVKENYLPLYREDLLAMISEGYEVVYHEHYVLPYLRRIVFDDFGITLKDPSHLKLILRKTGQ
jgi:hypothetical protein